MPASTRSLNSLAARPDLVKIVAMLPSAMRLAWAIASSRVAARAIDSTGPKISSWPTDMSVSVVSAVGDAPCDRVAMVGTDERSHLDAGLVARSDHHLGSRRAEGLEQ